jgi:hypothetical protein
MGVTFRMPAPDPAAFAVIGPLPDWLAWGRRLVERWGAETTYEVSAAGLRVRGTLYGRLVPAAALRVGAARRVDLAAEPALAPARRTNGLGLPGYGAGWFRLAGGGRALAFVTDRNRLVHVPTTAGYDLLLSVDDPDGLLAGLRGVVGAGAGARAA